MNRPSLEGAAGRMRPRLVIFVKEPRPGRVKTRLGAGIGMTGSAQWFRRQSAALIREMARDPRWQTVLAVSPDSAGLASPVWPAYLPRMPQGQGDLGQRMARVFRSLPPGPVIVIGADIPGITRARIARGFRALGPHEAVFGPAEDGGYWLVGLKRIRPVPCGFMRGVRWSTGHALADTRSTLPTDWRIAEVDRLRDVDTVDDLRALEAGVR